MCPEPDDSLQKTLICLMMEVKVCGIWCGRIRFGSISKSSERGYGREDNFSVKGLMGRKLKPE